MSLEGIAELPLHSGSVPPWLLRVMERMAGAILEIMVDELGPERVVDRFSNPLWFQAFNNAIGMDWDSSGSTTVLTGVLKAVTWRRDLGFLVLGGKGGAARRVPQEIREAAERLGLGEAEAGEVERASRLAAKVDSAFFQSGYDLYHHSVLLSEGGHWVIVQQGMNLETKTARRYHWRRGRPFFEDPHAAVSGVPRPSVINAVSSEARGLRKTLVDLAREGLERAARLYAEAYRAATRQPSVLDFAMPTGSGVALRALGERELTAYAPLPKPFEVERLFKSIDVEVEGIEDLALARGLGPKAVRALVLVSHLIYDEPPSFRDRVDTPLDPFIYAYAIGGKDGVPYPVDRREAERVVATLEDFVERARAGDKERLRALRRLRELRIKIVGKFI